MSHPIPDPIDRQLISLLQTNARESTANLARKLGLARTTVVARLARLELDGSIVGYTVKLGRDQAPTSVHAYVGITVQPRAGKEVVRKLGSFPELRRLASVSGEFDYMAELIAESTARLDVLLDEIGDIEGVVKTTSSLVLAMRLDRSA